MLRMHDFYLAIDMGCYAEGSGGCALVGPASKLSPAIHSAKDTVTMVWTTDQNLQQRCRFNAWDRACDAKCNGNFAETCGGGKLVSVYMANFTSRNLVAIRSPSIHKNSAASSVCAYDN